MTTDERRGQILQELLDVTPDLDQPVDIDAVRKLLRQRQVLLARLPRAGSLAEPLADPHRALIEEILRRDQRLVQELSRQRYRVMSVLQKAGARRREGPRLVSVRR